MGVGSRWAPISSAGDGFASMRRTAVIGPQRHPPRMNNHRRSV
ncbi:hypothetical protein F8B43_1163 [Methylorubrum populi]|uniref:Uncharacterized protein n=1 Tax=Methylorubrum populi TaxID=223967 RepID=A0A833J759_9HYPH|nr:hypothetical protein F8B43_1163 [Methylorubrum populi]